MRRKQSRGLIVTIVFVMIAAIAGAVWIGLTVKKADHRIQLGERLVAAVVSGTTEDVYGALLAGANPNDAGAANPMMEAIRVNKPDMAAYLIKAGADPTRSLFFAATRQEIETAVSMGADIKTTKAPYGMDLLSTHVVQAHPEAVAYLLDHGIRPADPEGLDKLLGLNEFAEGKEPKQGRVFTEIRQLLRERGFAH